MIVVSWRVVGRLFKGHVSSRILTAFSDFFMCCFLDHVIEMTISSFLPMFAGSSTADSHLPGLVEQGRLIQADVLDSLDLFSSFGLPLVHIEAGLLVLKPLQHLLVLGCYSVELLLSLLTIQRWWHGSMSVRQGAEGALGAQMP